MFYMYSFQQESNLVITGKIIEVISDYHVPALPGEENLDMMTYIQAHSPVYKAITIFSFVIPASSGEEIKPVPPVCISSTFMRVYM